MIIIQIFSSGEVVNEARSVWDVESPREKGNAVVGVTIGHVINEAELVAHRRRVALHLLALRVSVP